jgi:hypothetical protein
VTPSVLAVGAHDSGHVTVWHGSPPQVVSDGCDSWAAAHDHVSETGDRIGGGTSAATPFAAGRAARVLAVARELLHDASTGVDDGVVARGAAGGIASGPLADGVFTLDEWRRVVLATATRRPTAQREDGPPCEPGGLYPALPPLWSDVPDEYPEYTTIGYGALDDPALELATAVVRGTAELPDRSDTDAFFETEAALRNAFYDVYSTG